MNYENKMKRLLSEIKVTSKIIKGNSITVNWEGPNRHKNVFYINGNIDFTEEEIKYQAIYSKLHS